jgi:hypothetical protein
MTRGAPAAAPRAGGRPAAAGGGDRGPRRCAWARAHSRRSVPLIPKNPSDRAQPPSAGAPPRPGAGARPAAAAPEAPSAEHDLDRLADSIERFRLEHERFLSGATHVLPDELRNGVQRQLRELRHRNLKSAAEQFRLSTLEARYNTLAELYGRRLREREEGRAAKPRSAPAAPRLDADAGIVLDRALDPEAVGALLAALARNGGNAPDLDTFRTYLGRQLETIRAKTGAEEVQFRLALEEGKLKLKAKPIGVRP